MDKIKAIKVCRSCKSENLIPIISLGSLYVTNFVSSREEQGRDIPLELVLCDKERGGCGLLQLRHTSPPEEIWGDQYWYKSAINKMIRDDLNDIAAKSKRIVSLKEGDIVIDIGCNDGTLLGFYGLPGITLVGFEPSKNVAAEALSKGYDIINNFFNSEDFKKRFGGKKAKLITAISMFYDLDDPNKFVKDITQCLAPEGLFVIQQNYLVTMLENNAFDNICHEHLEYYAFGSLKSLLAKHGLEIFDIELNGINGGSLRTYIKFKGNMSIKQSAEAKKRIAKVEEKESQLGLYDKQTYLQFVARINKAKQDLLLFIKKERSRGKTFCGCGASTRGNTTLQYFGLNSELIKAIADRNPDKWGKKTVGSFIPIVSPEELKKMKPDYQIVFIWHIFKGLSDEEKEFLQDGGKFILPLPEFQIIEKPSK